ncbi:Ppx/GppA phosphatase family protein [Rhodohalobacter sulfatireducens]|uniref:Ppx/GppA family phosphatase n=1 Tax=Rhodohalobacter sulfatireducens TaxID=2911366 RepID=A0ABS9KG55_9BACT|nr:Ppx/GppA phosphatase family protein [Rhodohalobacter sulfatireducens]MCG2589828.1 Ppx/GppA family phosphatase [Rhodohalobacter sulfatireducens]
MKSASIDIGTNTALLLVAELKDGKLKPIVEKQRIPRLGRGVDKSRNLSPESMKRVLDNLLEYKEFLDENYPGVASRAIVTATSAVRDASNRSEFLDLVKQKTGWEIRLLSGKDEAETTYMGALSVLEGYSDQANLILDIGGGSSELAFGKGYELENAVSIDMGSVRFTERFFNANPPTSLQVSKAVEEVRHLLKLQQVPDGNFELIGVAGTITSIAAIELQLTEYDVDTLNGFHLKKALVNRFIDEFSKTKWENIEKKYSRFLKGRGEVVLAGILILREVMDWSNKSSIVTSTGGIRHGVLLNLLTK